MTIRAKICGLKTIEAVETAQNNGAEFLGFIFYPKSPRNITPEESTTLGKAAKAKKVAVTVDASDELLEAIIKNLKPDYIQLHGSEHDNRAMEIKHMFGIPLIRSVEPNKYPEIVRGEVPGANKELYDFLLVDAPKGDLPGGNGKPFDWRDFHPPHHPWFLSGGLNAGNIAEAVSQTHAHMVDVSSGVESAPGVKDLAKIKEFLKLVSKL